MKKLVFTAIAVIAFSGVSMASVVVGVNCEQKAIDALEAADPNNQFTQMQAHDFYQGVLQECQRNPCESEN